MEEHTYSAYETLNALERTLDRIMADAGQLGHTERTARMIAELDDCKVFGQTLRRFVDRVNSVGPDPMEAPANDPLYAATTASLTRQTAAQSTEAMRSLLQRMLEVMRDSSRQSDYWVGYLDAFLGEEPRD